MKEWKGSFLGFTFGNKHSSELGIFRTSNSNRYDLSILQQPNDIVTDLGAADGQYYWGSTYAKREFPISFAFYGLSEEQLALLKRMANDKKIQPLILDEEPYKVWSAKVTGVATVKHVCFSDDDSRYYHGEGTINFITFYPFARSRYPYYEDYTKNNIPEWAEAQACDAANLLISTEALDSSGIPKRADGYGEFVEEAGYKLYNAGDLPMPFKVYFSVNSDAQNFYLSCAGKEIQLENVVAKGEDKYIVLDGYTQTIQGCDINYNKTKNLYNERIAYGSLFDLPTGEIFLVSNPADKLEFNYLYL